MHRVVSSSGAFWKGGASLVAAVGLFASACAPAAQPAPPTSAAPTTAVATPPAKPTTAPAASPAASPSALPAASPAASPVVSPSPSAQVSISAPLEPMTAPSGNVKDTIVVAMGQMPDTLHPLIGSMMARTEVLGGLFARGVQNDNRGQWVAIGVEQVPTIDNGGATLVGDGDDRHLEVTFKIRKGLTWHDGQPTTSKDIKYAWELMLNPKFEATTRDASSKVFDIRTSDDQTAVVVYMSAKQARDAAQNGYKGLPAENWAQYKDQKDPLVDPFYFLLPGENDGGAGWLPEHILSKVAPEQQKGSDYSRNPVGNGPYKLKELVPDQSITLEAVDQWPLGKPPTKTVVFRIIPDKNAQIAAMRAGEVDVVTQVGGPDVNDAQELDSIQGYKAQYIPGTPWEHIDLYTKDPLLQDKNVRKALIMGINRQEIVDKLLAGRTRVANSWVQPDVPPWAYDESCLTLYKYDPAGAQQLLQQAGFTKNASGTFEKNGQPLQLKLQTTDATLRKNVAQVIQLSLKQVGVDLQLDFLPAQSFFGTEGPLTRGQFQLGMYTWLSSPDPDARTLYTSRAIPTQENSWSGQNYPRYSNAQVDDLLTRGANELSVLKRKPLYCEAQKTWTDDVPTIPLFQRPVTTAARSNMGNYRPTGTQTPETWNMWAWYVPR